MNIVILSDIKYKEYADLYIEGIQRFLKRNDKIIYFTIGFKYGAPFTKSVARIPRKLDSISTLLWDIWSAPTLPCNNPFPGKYV